MKTLQEIEPSGPGLISSAALERKFSDARFQFANEGEAEIIRADADRGYQHGQILFANDSRFLENYFSIPLTSYAVGWRDPNDIEATLNYIAPPVEVGRRFEYKKATNAEEFLSETSADIRAIGSDFGRVEYTMKDLTGRTLNKGLTYIADLDAVAGQPNWQQQKVQKLLRRLMRNELRRAKSLVSGAATNTAKTWSTTQDPDNDVVLELELGADDDGLRPNRVLYGVTAWVKRFGCYRAQNNAGAYQGAEMNEAQLQALLRVDGVKVSNERFQSAAATKTRIVDNLVWMFYGQDGVDTEDPTNFKRFVSSFDAEQGGGRVRTYVQQLTSKLVAITVEQYSDLVTTSTQGIRQFTVS